MPCPTIDHPIDTTKCEEIGPGIVAQKRGSQFFQILRQNNSLSERDPIADQG
ncbi:hypothetical protein V3C99_002724 [Haemonchus contortus]